jgi:hypothetical protein
MTLAASLLAAQNAAALALAAYEAVAYGDAEIPADGGKALEAAMIETAAAVRAIEGKIKAERDAAKAHEKAMAKFYAEQDCDQFDRDNAKDARNAKARAARLAAR